MGCRQAEISQSNEVSRRRGRVRRPSLTRQVRGQCCAITATHGDAITIACMQSRRRSDSDKTARERESPRLIGATSALLFYSVTDRFSAGPAGAIGPVRVCVSVRTVTCEPNDC